MELLIDDFRCLGFGRNITSSFNQRVMIRAAIFADIHGKFLLPFRLCDRWQRENNQKIDLILQCGDMGAFPNVDALDKATIRHAKNDRDELGFLDDFVVKDPEIEAFLAKLNLDMICVRGNHEDHEFLDELEAQAPDQARFSIDAYERVWVCKSGWEQQFEKGNDTLEFVGIGRIGDRKKRTDGKFIQDYERKKIRKLYKRKSPFDLLISHDKDDASERGYGSWEIREALDEIIFRWHFYGHTGEPFNIVRDVNGITESCKIKELEFEPSGILAPGSMLILEKENDEIRVEAVAQKFTNPSTKFSWRTL